jgi:hypothetical protein
VVWYWRLGFFWWWFRHLMGRIRAYWQTKHRQSANSVPSSRFKISTWLAMLATNSHVNCLF